MIKLERREDDDRQKMTSYKAWTTPTFVKTSIDKDVWIVDFGCIQHMIDQCDRFKV
jgi:hypothetical protein